MVTKINPNSRSMRAPLEVAAPAKKIPTPGSWKVQDIHYVSLLGRFLKNHQIKKLPKDKRKRFKEAMSRVINSSHVFDDLTESTIDLSLDLREGDGLYTRVQEEWVKIADFADFAKGKKSSPAYQFFKELKGLQEYVSAKEMGEVRVKRSRKEVQGLFRNVQAAYPKVGEPTMLASALMLPAAVGDAGSVLRNSLSASSSIGPEALPVHILGVAGGVLAFLSGVVIGAKGRAQRLEASAVDDHEGRLQGQIFESIGWTLSGVGVSFTVAKSAVLTGNAKVAAISGATILPLYGAVSALAVVYGIHGLQFTTRFRGKLQEYLNDPNEEARYKGVMRFLQNRLMPSPIKVQKIRKEIDEKHAEKTPSMRKALFEEALKKYMEKKRLKFARRTSDACGEKVALNVERILQGLENPGTKEAALKEAKELTTEVLKENFKNIVKYLLIITVGLVGIGAVIAATIFTGPLPYILMVLTAALWFGVDTSLSSKLGDLLWNKYFIPENLRPESAPAV